MLELFVLARFKLKFMKITNINEQQNYISKQCEKLKKLTDIGAFLNLVIRDEAENTRRVLKYHETISVCTNHLLFAEIDNYKNLLLDLKEIHL